MNTLKRVSIIGGGTQGSMLAFRSLAYGKEVFLYSRSERTLQSAKEKIFTWLKEWESEGKLEKHFTEEAMQRLQIEKTIETAVKTAEIVLENVSEDLELKQKIWAEIDAYAPEYALLTTNSSSLKSSEIGEFVRRKEKTFNVNFMTPTKDDMVEVMWNAQTSEETKELALQFLQEQDQVPVVTQREIQGFSLNRVWRAIKKESLNLWAEGYITPEDLDRAWMLEWGTPYGPFGLMDKVGLDIVEQIEYSYFRETNREDDLPPKTLSNMVAQGYLGEKSGKGFYAYPNPAYESPDWLRGKQ